MQDEQFMQTWNAGHTQFSADLDRGLGHLAERLSRRAKRVRDIRDPYGIPGDIAGRTPLSPAAKASLRGLFASVITAALWVVVLALATPTPGFAASPTVPMANVECVAHSLLA